MKQTHRKPRVARVGLGFVLALLTGCQTWVGGMTLPSGHYLKHPPQYFPPSPPFPLPRELASQEAIAAAGRAAAAPVVPTAPAPQRPAAPIVPPAQEQ